MLVPMKGKQFEAGIKYRPDDADYSIDMAYYHIIQSNAAAYAGYNENVGYYYRAIGEVTTDGFEIEARKSLANGFSVIGAYNYNDAIITKSGDAAEIGNQPSTTPFHNASLWVSHTNAEGGMLAGLTTGLGVRLNSASYKDTTNDEKNHKAVYLDAVATYDFGKQRPDLAGLSASLSVKNIFDKRLEVCTDGYCYFGQGRTVLGSLKYKW
jgi:iron complex outermembrane recepter protein